MDWHAYFCTFLSFVTVSLQHKPYNICWRIIALFFMTRHVPLRPWIQDWWWIYNTQNVLELVLNIIRRPWEVQNLAQEPTTGARGSVSTGFQGQKVFFQLIFNNVRCSLTHVRDKRNVQFLTCSSDFLKGEGVHLKPLTRPAFLSPWPTSDGSRFTVDGNWWNVYCW